MKALTLLASYLAGLFAVPFPLFKLPMSATKLPYFDSIYGNAKGLSTDGLAEIKPRTPFDMPLKLLLLNPPVYLIGVIDHLFRVFMATFPRYYWLALRNPSNALGYRLGLHGQITSMVKSKPNNHTRGFYTATAMANGETGTFYYGVHKWPFLNRYFRYAFGSTIWSSYKVGDIIDSGYKLSVLPFITRRTAGV